MGFNLEEKGVCLHAPEAALEVNELIPAHPRRKRGKCIELP